MSSYFIESFKIDKLWGHRDIALTFKKDVNILIGPNASGKTTILNLLHSILSADLRGVLDVNFEHAMINLRSFKSSSKRTIKISITDRALKLSVGQNKFEIDINFISDRIFPKYYMPAERDKIPRERLPRYLTGRVIELEKLYDVLNPLVPLVWLPVNRRLPVTEDEAERYSRVIPLESVDLRLKELSEDISRYHSSLNTLLSERYKDFERQVLSVILYSKEHDQLESILNSVPSSLPMETQKEQLLKAFEAAELSGKEMRSRIDEHFAIAEDVVKRLNSEKPDAVKPGDSLVLPLIGRTKAMVEYAGELEKDREDIFEHLRRYEDTVNSFLNNKTIKVDESGQLKIESSSPSDLNPRLLSSGEKQILILLTEVLLKVDEPVVYIADEPELSLHVTWQEKLLESLVTLGGQKQIIVATHSPDIVGQFRDNVITLGKKS